VVWRQRFGRWGAATGTGGVDALSDQQLAGLLMWGIGGLAPALIAIAVLIAWARAPRPLPAAGRKRTRRREVTIV
jgi:cytochrome c oxidase assembly factor CtaG